MDSVFKLAFGLMAASVTMAGGYWVANQPRSWLTPARLRGILALGAGFLLALVLLELLPSAIAGKDAHDVFAIVLLGAASVFAFDRWVAPRLSFLEVAHEEDGCAHHHDYAHDHGHDHGEGHGPTPDHAHAACGHPILGHGAACSALGCLIVCTFFDGVALSASMAGGSTLGTLVLIGLLLHLIPEGLLAATVVLASGGSARIARRMTLLTGSAFFVGALVPMILGPVGAVALPLASGILLFVALGQLIPASAITPAGAWLVLAGGSGFWLLERLIAHGH